MGLLDDAIREHLDLKRRHGADPSDIERAEREALGPVRRSPNELDRAALDAEHAPASDVAYAEDEEEEEVWGEPFEHEELPEEAEPGYHGEEPSGAETGQTPPPHPGLGSPAPRSHGDEETAEYDVELDHRHGEEGEDVLEETPDFLQDTPDHDRLWFEQRPPRDFDFDG